ncbi:MAG: molecular chaperone HtpG [Alphaproteobacteria bacterium]|nr:molecular chaperone HtpG [Alphaproteobacteria bacterium]
MTPTAATAEKRSFQAEVSKLLHIVANSLYSNKEVFLRELISNASDACDKLRYEAIHRPELTKGDADFCIRLIVDTGAGTLSVTDNGIGMSRQELIDNLGTIARSGTSAFVDQLAATKEKGDAVQLIGQFGVGFYSAFMVADEVTVISRRADEATAARWQSDGHGEFSVEAADRDTRGTMVTLHLKKSDRAFLEAATLRRVVKTHSDHIGIPIILEVPGTKNETVNVASALWTRPRKDISADQYREFYHHVAQSFDEPWLTLHAKAEGKIEYSLLLFVPTAKPFDLFDPARRSHIRLYVRRVFVTDRLEGLVPPYLRFLRGIVDSEDLDLNVSREMLQQSAVVARIKKDLTKRVFKELEKKATEDADGFTTFWNNFGAVLKEGLYEDADARDALLKIVRFRSTVSGAKLMTLDDYVARLRPGQRAIYYVSGDDRETIDKSPQLEGFRAKDVEVLLLSDPVDDFWVGAMHEYKGKAFKSVTRGSADLAAITADDGKAAQPATEPADNAKLNSLIASLKLTLGAAVKDVRVSERLTESPLCLVADDGALDMHMERMLRQHRRVEEAAPRILELNPRHDLIKACADLASESGASDRLGDAAHLLHDYARILEGEAPANVAAFSRRWSALMAVALRRSVDQREVRS